MSGAYDREQQNNSRLDELSSKVSALRGVTVNIYDNARDQGVIDSSSEVFSSMGTSIKGSAGRLGRMAQQGNKVAILKLAGMIIGVVIVLWYGMSWAFRSKVPDEDHLRRLGKMHVNLGITGTQTLQAAIILDMNLSVVFDKAV